MNEKHLKFIDAAIFDTREEVENFQGYIGRLDYELSVFEDICTSRHEDYADDMAKISRLRFTCSKVLRVLDELEEEMSMFKEAFYDDPDND